MQQIYGFTKGLLIILHGGAGPQDPSEEGVERAVKALRSIGNNARKRLLEGDSAIDVATLCLTKLEDDPQFNAGVGSALQSDGISRLSASLMDGRRQNFSGVISASYLRHPSKLARMLQDRRAKVITNPGIELLARELAIPVHSNLTEHRSKRWLEALDQTSYPTSFDEGSDTVGCVIRDCKGKLVAAASTGGRGHEFPGRVSDTTTVAGNYASKYAAITVTGHGEQIVDDAVAARIETRVRDDMNLEHASAKTFSEAVKRKRRYGWIAVDSGGGWSVAYTTHVMPFVVLGDKGIVKAFEFPNV